MPSKSEMTRNFLEANLEKLRCAHKEAREGVLEKYEEILDAQKDLVLTCILERVNEYFTYVEDVKKNKDPYIQMVALRTISEMNVDKLLVFTDRSRLFPETMELAALYGLKIVKASKEECIRAKVTPWDRVYHLVGTINVGSVSQPDIEKEGEINA